jgi:hypothetical protein
MALYLKSQNDVAVTNHINIVPVRPAESGLGWYTIDASSGGQSDVPYQELEFT